MKNKPALVYRWSVEGLIRVACVLAVFALAFMVWSVLVPTALPVVLGMSVGQGLGLLAFSSFVLAVISDAARSRRVSMNPGPPDEDAEDGSEDDAEAGP